MSNRPVVLLVIGQLDRGGAEMHLARVVPQLDSQRYQIILFCFKGGGALEGSFLQHGVTVISPPVRASRIARLVQCAVTLLKTLFRSKPRVIHFFLPEAYILGALVSLFGPKSVRIMSRRSLNNYQRRRPILALLERIIHHSVHGALANSEAVRTQLLSEGFLSKDTAIIYNGVPEHEAISHSEQAKVRATITQSDDTMILICVANLIPYKGHADILQALALISEELDWKIIFIGEDRGILDDLRSSAQELGLEEKIEWKGGISMPIEYFDIADIALLASHEEGFSNFVLEAMAAGLPLIATDVGGNSEALQAGACGLLVPAKDPKSLSLAIAKLINDRHLREELGSLAKTRVARVFSQQRCLESYDALYSRLIEPNPPKIADIDLVEDARIGI